MRRPPETRRAPPGGDGAPSETKSNKQTPEYNHRRRIQQAPIGPGEIAAIAARRRLGLYLRVIEGGRP